RPSMSTIAASGGTAPPADRGLSKTLVLRLLSALVLAPLALALAFLGGWWFAALIAVAALLMGWEWARLTGGTGRRDGLVLGLAVVAAVLLATAGRLPEGFAALGAGALLGWFARFGRQGWWAALGALWLGLP